MATSTRRPTIRQIQQWWRSEPSANVAIATGAPGPDVVDVDRKGEGSGYPAWNELKRAGLVGEPQAIIRTPSGGMHAYYKGTEHQRNGHLPAHQIDFRSTGGYVVTPPSQVGGRPYAVVSKQASAATVDWQKVREHLDPQPERQPYRAPERGADRPRDVSHLAGWVARQPEGNRNEGLFWAANRALEAGDTATLDGLAQAARDAGLDAREIDRTIRSAQQTATRGAGRPFEHQAPAGPGAARAAGQTSHSTPARGGGKLMTAVAELPAIGEEDDAGAVRVPAGGTRLRLRALAAMGHSDARIARALGESPRVVTTVMSARARTVSRRAARRRGRAVRGLVGQAAARADTRRARGRGRGEEPGPAQPLVHRAGLDDDELDVPGYRPRATWRPATGTGVAGDDPLGAIAKRRTPPDSRTEAAR